MNFSKISIDDQEVLKKRRIQFTPYEMSSMVEEFDCGGTAVFLEPGKKESPSFGISKCEGMISFKRYYMNSLRRKLSGGA